jgi:hypothetical protein
MICPYCGREARWCDNSEIYGKRYGKSYMCYWCKDCDAYVGCHNNTKAPLGSMANKELRQWRMKVHDKMDPLWKSGNIKRSKLYSIISKIIGKPYHTGECDIEMCKKILSIDITSIV